MPGQRILTAIVLLLLLGLVLWAPGHWPVLVFLALMCALALWEWLRMTPLSTGPAIALAVAFLLFLLLAAEAILLRIPLIVALAEQFLLPVAALFWLAMPLLLHRPQRLFSWPAPVRALLGACLFAACWYGLAWLYLQHGVTGLLSMWALVWWADIAAYAYGRRWGKTRLAPSISPGKTVEGAAAGLAAGVLWLAGTAVWWPGSFAAVLLARLGTAGLILAAVGLVIWSVLGDLFESVLKRHAGVKDSSRLLPGHGGVYDRIDAVLPVAVFAAILLIHG